MIGAGTFISPLLRIVTTVAILAAVYLFIVKPILDTTNDTVNRAFDAANPALRQAQHLANQQGVDNFTVPAPARRSTRRAERVLKCVQRAGGDVSKIQNCAS